MTNAMPRPQDEDQLAFLPFGHPATVLNHFERLVRQVTRLAPDIDANSCVRVLGELALLARCLDSIEAQLKREAEAKAQRFGLIAGGAS